MSAGSGDASRAGVPLTNLDQPLFDGAGATKGDLVDYLDGVRERIIPALEDRPLSVIRIHRGGDAFMQKNVPKYTPSWVPTVEFWAETSKRNVSYALCNDRRTLVWFANQRAVEYHPTLVLAARPDRVTHLVLDLDPPDADDFAMAVRTAHLVRAGPDRRRVGGRREDKRRQGRARVRARRRPRAARRGGRRDEGDRGASRGARPLDRHHRLHQGRPRREGVRRLDQGRRGDRHRRLQPTGPTGRAGVVPGAAGKISTPSRRPTSRCTRRSATSATAIRGPRRCRRRSG